MHACVRMQGVKYFPEAKSACTSHACTRMQVHAANQILSSKHFILRNLAHAGFFLFNRTLTLLHERHYDGVNDRARSK